MLIAARIEENMEVLERVPSGEACVMPLSALPEGLREGDVLRETPAGLAIDKLETARRRAAAAANLGELIKP